MGWRGSAPNGSGFDNEAEAVWGDGPADVVDGTSRKVAAACQARGLATPTRSDLAAA
jgi:hypothetical protein